MIEMEPTPPGWDGHEIAWCEDGANVPQRAIGAAIAAVGLLLALVVSCVYLAIQGTNSGPHPGTPGGPPVPSTYGPPPAANLGMVR